MLIKKINRILVLSLLLLSFQSGLVFANNNLIQNPSFEDLLNNKPKQWFPKENLTPGTIFDVVDSDINSGSKCLRISNTSPADTMIIQDIKVKKNTAYKISVRVKAENIINKSGAANITLYYVNNGVGCKGIYTSQELFETGGKWATLTFNILTRKDIDHPLTFCLRLGGQGILNQGTAYFDNISMVAVSESSLTSDIFDFNKNIPGLDNSVKTDISNIANSNSNSALTKSSSQTANSNSTKTIGYIVIILLVLSIIILVDFRFSKKRVNKKFH